MLMNYSEKIKEYRKEKGFSQTDMAKKIGISQAAYGKIESGFTKNITIEVGKGIAKALGISFGELFKIEGYQFASAEKDALINSLKESKILLEKKIKELEERLEERKATIDLLLQKIDIYKRAIYESFWVQTNLTVNIIDKQIKMADTEEEIVKLKNKKDYLLMSQQRLLDIYIYMGILTENDIEQFKKNPEFFYIPSIENEINKNSHP